jgi:hypothetical protein
MRKESGVLRLLCAAAASLCAQDVRATLTGAVTDPQGAVVPNAKMTNVVVTAATSEAGIYVVPNLNPGQYSVTASAAGFKSTVQKNIELRVADRRSVDLKLELGAASEAVTITAEAAMLDTASASGGTTINQQLVSDLPLVGGNPYALLQQAPGVSPHIWLFSTRLRQKLLQRTSLEQNATRCYIRPNQPLSRPRSPDRWPEPRSTPTSASTRSNSR